MKTERTVLYIGKQRDLFSEIESYFRRKEDSYFFYSCVKHESVEVLFDLAETGRPSLVILDFCEDRNCLSAMEAISHLKNWSLDRSFPVCAVFDDKDQVKEANELFGMGLNYCFLKGVDTKQSLNSLFYIAYEDESSCINYALAKLPKINARVKSLGCISSFDENSLTIDKDFHSEGEELSMETNLFEEFSAKKFALEESFEKGFSYHTPFSEVARIPFATGWDVDEDCVFEDTFQSWLGLNRESFVVGMDTVFVYCASAEAARIVWNWTQKSSGRLNIVVRSRFKEEDRELIKNRPALVLFEISDDKSMDDLTRMIGQMSYEKALDKSIVSVFNHPSSTQALRKLYARHNLIATKEKISSARLCEMLDRLEKEPSHSSKFSFKKGDPRINVCLPVDTQITSLTENEITFMCREELPLYSVLKMDIPVECFVVLIPSLKKLTPNIHGHHYMGFIFGGDGADANYLRKFVNYIINNGIDRWQKVNFDSRSSEDEQASLAQTAKAEKAPDKEPGESLEKATNESASFRPKSKNLFSKL